MRKVIIFLLMGIILLGGCRAKRSYNSMEGKKKLKHYNSIPYK